MLKIFHVDVYPFLDLGTTLSFVAMDMDMRFYFLSLHLLMNILFAKRVNRSCLISLLHRSTHVDLVELDILDLYVTFVWEDSIQVMFLLIVEPKLSSLNFQMNQF